ncbi:GTP 3',8-cyclase MoaA [Acinetobacter sp. WZC-1]|uniref:GTP 3',8-cyclase MoaA n=1 Tax=Acinetobacter sp. WZC-1 TaxID=3459034 RepID=UPI00403E0B6D
MNSMAMTHQPLLVDQFGRHKRKLRISVTDRCNFKCVYCMPEHPEWIKKHQLLSFEALYRFCEFMVHRGIEHLRITGGEPLMRQGVVHFVAQLQQLKQIGLKRISMTTNGHYLKRYAEALKQAGLDDLNISLDSLDPQQFRQLTQKELTPVLEGIQAAQAAGLNIKINTVLIRGMNDDQILPLARWSKQHGLMLRFIEFMPLDGDRKWSAEHVISEHEILAILRTEFRVQMKSTAASDPARQYLMDDHPVGLISTITHSFCGSCDRVRLTAQGEFYNCLFATQGLNLKEDIVALAALEPQRERALQNKLLRCIWHKEAGFHAIRQKQQSRKISMHMPGG